MIRTLCNNIYLRLILLYPFTLLSQAWWVDPLGAILISLVIIYRWGNIMSEQVKKIVGHTAPPDFIIKVCAMFSMKKEEIIVFLRTFCSVASFVRQFLCFCVFTVLLRALKCVLGSTLVTRYCVLRVLYNRMRQMVMCRAVHPSVCCSYLYCHCIVLS
jgi:hypothetical protein